RGHVRYRSLRMATAELAPVQAAVDADDVLDVTVVLPVYNEKGHLAEEIDRIRRALAGSGKTFEILVVDDGSDDGSGEQLRTID
ncbi:glycosyltransferase, partial [Listeria monocytogenes]|uniref:glycosyltransferase n=1 Tax=Listeria monocytogenes TaxID=1639 RepID=UPI002FDC0D1F